MGSIFAGDVHGSAHSGQKRRKAKIPPIQTVAPEQVQEWLKRGLDDFKRYPVVSLLYGTLAVISCYFIVLMTAEVPALGLGFVSGLLILGPFLAVGLYDAGRSMENGQPVSMLSTLRVMKRRALHIGILAAFLAVLMIAWLRLSTLIIALNVRSSGTGLEFLTSEVFALDNIVWLSVYMLIGLLFASVAFITNCIALPMIMDRGTDTVTAIITSVRAVRENRETMVLWAAAIVAASWVGLVTLFFGFAVIFPVLGYATWHSYRDLVSRDE